MFFLFFFFNDTATTEIYTLSLHDALPISVIRAGTLIDGKGGPPRANQVIVVRGYRIERVQDAADYNRSEEHTSELQSRLHLVCRLLLEKKKKTSLRHMTL